MGAHIGEFRKVTAAVPLSGEPRAGLAGGSRQPKGGRSVAERLGGMLLWGELYSGGLLYSRSRKEAPSSAAKAAAVTGGRRRCSAEVTSRIHAKPQLSLVLSGERVAAVRVRKHMDACACFLRRGEPSLPGWVNVHCHWRITENGSFCFYGSFLECGNISVEFLIFFFIWTEKVFIQQRVSRLK